MPNIATVLKEEISRLARKEIRQQTEGLRKASAQRRHDLAELKRQVAKLQRQVALLERQVPKEPSAVDAPVGRLRFSAKGLRAQRGRLGLSGPDCAALVGVSTQSIYNWERGITRPRKEQLPAIAALRGMGKREAKARLQQLASQKTKSAKKS